MDWRCTECGRISDTRTEACTCGAQAFERATVRHTKRCTECGETAADSATVCPECGFSSFEPLGDSTTVDDVDISYEQWRCTECGRTTPRNTPPCDRCGNMNLERERVEGEEFNVDEFVGGGERVLTWRLVVAIVAILFVVFLIGRVL